MGLAALAAGQEDPLEALVDSLVTPAGLEVHLWARAPMVHNPTSIDVDARGRIWVAEAVNYREFNNEDEDTTWREGGDRIVILEDTDEDGRADKSTVFVQDPDLVAPLGVAVIGDLVVVSCSPHLIVYTKDADDQVVGKEILLTGFGGLDHDHSLHAAQLGPDGRLHFNVGNAGQHVVTDRAGWTLRAGSWYTGGSPHNTKNTPGLVSDDGRIWHGGLALAVELDGTGLEVLGHGFRNAVGTCIDPFGELWMNDNDDTQSCRTTYLLPYGDCGYNSKDGTRSWQADRRPGQSIPTSHWRQDDPGVIPSGHVYGNGSPTGITIFEGKTLGREYSDGLLLSCEAGQNVVWAYPRKPEGAGFALEPFVLLGTTDNPDPDYVWSKREENPARWFRPSDVAVGTEGALYVADWFDPVVGGHQMDDQAATGAIYRVLRAESEPLAPDLAGDELGRVLARLRSPATNVHMHAISELVARGEDAVPMLRTIFNARNASRELIARAAWAAGRIGGAAELLCLSLALHPDPEKRAVAWRALARGGADLTATETARSKDGSPIVRRDLALSLRERPFEERRALLVTLAQSFQRDPWMCEALGTACEGHEAEAYALLMAEVGDDDPLAWSPAFADLAFRLHPPASIPAFRTRALSSELPRRARRRAIDALGFVGTTEAGAALIDVIADGPVDLQPLARWWITESGAPALRARRDQLPSRFPGEPRFDSGVVHRGGVSISVDVTGAQQLWLVASEADGSIDFDMVDWVDGRLTGAGGSVRLEELGWSLAENGWGTLHKGKSCKGDALRVGGQTYEHGIGTHAPGVLMFDLGGKYERLEVIGGVDDDCGARPDSRSSVRLFVYHDGPSEAERVATLVAALGEGDEAARVATGRRLVATTAGARVLLSLLEQGALDQRVAAALAQSMVEHPDFGVRAVARGSFGTYLAGFFEAPSVAALGLEGDVARGKELFFQAEVACSRCHGMDGRGGAVGPDLTEIGKKYGAEELLAQILEPSAQILSGFETWILQTEDGLVHVGFLRGDGDEVVLEDAQGRKLRFAADEITARKQSETSTMPDNVALGLSGQDLADLLAYLRAPR